MTTHNVGGGSSVVRHRDQLKKNLSIYSVNLSEVLIYVRDTIRADVLQQGSIFNCRCTRHADISDRRDGDACSLAKKRRF